jgi:hypothetical protein
LEQATSNGRTEAIAAIERRRGTRRRPSLLAQLHPLVPGALEKLLVLLLAHLLPALLD